VPLDVHGQSLWGVGNQAFVLGVVKVLIISCTKRVNALEVEGVLEHRDISSRDMAAEEVGGVKQVSEVVGDFKLRLSILMVQVWRVGLSRTFIMSLFG
jgi:hypothetical protein